MGWVLMNSCGMGGAATPTLRVEKANGCWVVGVDGVLTAAALLWSLPVPIKYCVDAIKVAGKTAKPEAGVC